MISAMKLTPANFAEALKSPFDLLPEDVQPNALLLWSSCSHFTGLETAFPVVVDLARWIEQDVINARQANRILRKMLTPKAKKEFKFASDVTAKLAELVHGESTMYDGYDIVPPNWRNRDGDN